MNNAQKYKEYTISILQDENAESPREWDNIGKMVLFHKRYDLPCEVNISSDDFGGWDEMKKFIIDEHKAIAVLPVYMYDHSGITLKTTPFGDDWDSGQVGFIFADKNEETKTMTQAQIENLLEGEVKTYADFLEGNVYGFKVERPDGEEIESVWGFYGDMGMDDALEEAKSIVDSDIKRPMAETWTLTVKMTVFAGDMPKENVISNAEDLLPKLLDGTDFTGITVEEAKRDEV